MKRKPANDRRLPGGWTDADAEFFRNGGRVRASTMPNKKAQHAKKACRNVRLDDAKRSS